MFNVADIRLGTTTPPAPVIGAVECGESPATEGGTLPVCTISIRRYPDWSAVMLRGELDRKSAAEVLAAVAMELAEDRPVIIELVGLDFCDVEGLRTLADLARRSGRLGARIELHGARGQVARLIELLGLEDLTSPA